MEKSKNVPFVGDTKKVKGNILNYFPNRRQRREYMNVVPNSTKVSKKGRGKGVYAPIRSIKQLQKLYQKQQDKR